VSLTELANACGTDKGDWQGFMPLYEKYLPDCDEPVNLLELGVYQGQSMRLWSRHFRNAWSEIIGIDLDLTQCPPMFDNRVSLVQADQADAIVADQLLADDMFDVIIDDASHISSKTIAAFHVWWPRLKPGGLYVVEDTHCSYDTKHYGYESAGPPPQLGKLRMNLATTMNFLKRLADDVNWDHHGRRRFPAHFEDLAYVHFYPGICFIGKKP
jgi:8-demethyl-8-(2-methoxy-alpha-L-rhamnosyl)tetracenomycin-C 3'-O-methyltransferase